MRGGQGETARLAREDRYQADKKLLMSSDLFQKNKWFTVNDILPEWNGLAHSAVRYSLRQFLYYGLLEHRTEGGNAMEKFRRRPKEMLAGEWLARGKQLLEDSGDE